MTPKDLNLNGRTIRFDPGIVKTMDPNLFDVDWLRANGLWQGSTKGRSKAHFFHHDGRDMVLRHFHRGGLIGRVNRDFYVGLGAEKSRAFREFALLAEMKSEGLPVPAPVAAQYGPIGPFYRADIITQRIPNAQTLDEKLCDKDFPDGLWRVVGTSVRNLHDRGVYHSDLNCRNIMIDASNHVWFIDFDKCERRTPGAWTQGNLDRLQRSLRKISAGSPKISWREADWTEFLDGYQND